MNSPSNRRRAWSWLLIGITCCGLSVAHIAGSFVTAQENPVAGPPPVPAHPPVPPPVAAPEFLPRLSANAERISKALDESTEMALVDTPLLDALIFLKELHNIELWVDKEALSAEGIATDQLVSLSISGISLRSGLQLLLQPLQLTWVIENEVLKITTQEAASKVFVTRTYPAGDLFDSREESHELVEVIVSGLGLRPKSSEVAPRNASIKTPAKAVESVGAKESGIKNSSGITADVITLTELIQEDTSGKWETATSEPGTIAVSFKARAIVARQTHAVHDQIRQLLRDLREAKSFAPAQPLADWSVPDGRTLSGYVPPSAYPPSKPTPLDEFSPGFRPDSRRTLPDPDQDNLEPPAKLPASPKLGTVR